ncbi:hypothetical protein [Streptacidiphilus carbonis]|uniref:hypothetical protein n=1 Tax=Streptacidiphilus carbonis TaxID=105422 RepID=UPI00126989B4|nr:hypothetical protein [Streptacidiphilus carbonis]
MAVFLAAGCASSPTMPTATQQVHSTLLSAYHRTTALSATTASVNETVESGTDPVETAQGAVTLEFSRKRGETQLTINNTDKVVVLRAGDIFFEAKTQSGLNGTGQNLIQVGRQSPQAMPQVQAPGLDPFQLTTLMGAIDWNDSILNMEPVVTEDATGQHTEYQLTVSTAKLAKHEPVADQTWLTTLSTQPGGAEITVDATLSQGRIQTLSAHLPIATPQAATKAAASKGALPAPQAMTIQVALQFNYTQQPQPIQVPS